MLVQLLEVGVIRQLLLEEAGVVLRLLSVCRGSRAYAVAHLRVKLLHCPPPELVRWLFSVLAGGRGAGWEQAPRERRIADRLPRFGDTKRYTMAEWRSSKVGFFNAVERELRLPVVLGRWACMACIDVGTPGPPLPPRPFSLLHTRNAKGPPLSADGPTPLEMLRLCLAVRAATLHIAETLSQTTLLDPSPPAPAGQPHWRGPLGQRQARIQYEKDRVVLEVAIRQMGEGAARAGSPGRGDMARALLRLAGGAGAPVRAAVDRLRAELRELQLCLPPGHQLKAVVWRGAAGALRSLVADRWRTFSREHPGVAQGEAAKDAEGVLSGMLIEEAVLARLLGPPPARVLPAHGGTVPPAHGGDHRRQWHHVGFVGVVPITRQFLVGPNRSRAHLAALELFAELQHALADHGAAPNLENADVQHIRQPLRFGNSQHVPMLPAQARGDVPRPWPGRHECSSACLITRKLGASLRHELKALMQNHEGTGVGNFERALMPCSHAHTQGARLSRAPLAHVL